MNILDKIVADKMKEVTVAASLRPITQLENQPMFGFATCSLRKSLRQVHSSGIIAEFKRKSPSKGSFHEHITAKEITTSYMAHGAAGLSILTDTAYFGGSIADLVESRVNKIPILRKEFIVDPYQIIEAKSIGADAILLIASCLTKEQVREYSQLAQSLKLEVLLEIHDSSELDHICATIDMVGVNNRNLKDFSVDINRSLELARHIPSEFIAISESGISNVQTIQLLREAGYEGFLMGETFMRTLDPAKSFQKFMVQLNQLEYED